MRTRELLALIACVGGLMGTAHDAAAQTPSREYPIKPVRIIVPTSPGGLLDLASRVLAQKMTELTGQNVLVDNRPGASNNIGMELASVRLTNGSHCETGRSGVTYRVAAIHLPTLTRSPYRPCASI